MVTCTPFLQAPVLEFTLVYLAGIDLRKRGTGIVVGNARRCWIAGAWLGARWSRLGFTTVHKVTALMARTAALMDPPLRRTRSQ